MLPMFSFCCVTPVNCGNASSNCEEGTVVPFNVVPGSRPAKGFATFAVSALITAWSRTGDLLKYWLRDLQHAVPRKLMRDVEVIPE